MFNWKARRANALFGS